MRVLKAALVMSVLVGASACGRDAEPKLAAPSNDLTWLDSLGVSDAAARPVATAAVSPTELGLAASDSMAKTLVAAAPVKEPEAKAAESAPRRSTSRRSSSSSRRRSSGSSSSGTYAGSSGGYESSGTYRAPTAVVKRNTRRDAAIGAGAGAVIGAVAGGSRHRVRNGVVGAVLGGAAGAVIGHTVDKKTVYVP